MLDTGGLVVPPPEMPAAMYLNKVVLWVLCVVFCPAVFLVPFRPR